jgi:hypothetical protein
VSWAVPDWQIDPPPLKIPIGTLATVTKAVPDTGPLPQPVEFIDTKE